MISNTQLNSRYLRLIGISVLCITVYLLFTPILLVAFVYRALVALLWKSLRPDLDSFASKIDLSMVSNIPDKALSNLIMCFVVSGNVSENRIQEMFHRRVINLKDSKGNLIYKKLTQYSTTFLGFAFWKTDTSFNISNHVRKYDYEDVILSRPCDEVSLKEVISQILMLPWKSNTSHWEVLLVSGYRRKLKPENDNHHSLVIFRFDHSLVDGISAIGLFRVLFQSPFIIPNAVRNGKRFSIWENIKYILLFPYEATKQLPILLRGRYLSKLDPTKVCTYDCSESISVGTIKTIKQKHGIDYASVLHSAVNGGICHILEMLKKTAPKYIDMATTLPLPDHPGGASNHMRVFLTDLPLKCNSSLDRLLVTNHVLRKQGADWSSFAFLDALKLLDKFPLTICRKIFSSMYKTGPSYTLSILPSTSSREFIDNGEIVDAYFVVGTTTTTGMNIGVWGINNQQRVNIYYTPNTFGSEIPNGSFSKYLAQELEMLDNLS